MSDEQPDDDQSTAGGTIEEVGQRLDAGHVADVVQEILDDIQQQLNDNMVAIRRLIPYLSGMYYTDRQRRYAEKELFRLQNERTELEARMRNALVMVPSLLYPVAAMHT